MYFAPYDLYDILSRVRWEVEFHKDFDPEFDALPDDVQNELRAHALLREEFGPQLGRPASKLSKARATRI
jgi:hypothetical protein